MLLPNVNGGDINRKRKLLEKTEKRQENGMRQIGNV